MKHRLKRDGNESVTNCNQLKMRSSDGKMYKTDVADMEQLLRIIQVIPSPKAEPFKQWMAEVGAQRLTQLNDPLLSINQAMADYNKQGYSDSWINQRLKSTEVRKDTINKASDGKTQNEEMNVSLTDIIYHTWLDITQTKNNLIEKESKAKSSTITHNNVANLLAEFASKPIE